MTEPSEIERWKNLPPETMLSPKELARCPLIGGSEKRPLHPVTLNRWRTRGYGPKHRKLDNKRVYYQWRDVLKYFASCPARVSTTGGSP